MPNSSQSDYGSIAEATEVLPAWLQTTPSTELSPLIKAERWRHDPEVIGRRVRNRREATGMSLRDMAKWMSVSRTYLSDLERGLRPWPLKRLADATSVLEMAEYNNTNDLCSD